MTDEIKDHNRQIAKALGFATIAFSRLDARLAYVWMFLTTDSLALDDDVSEATMLKLTAGSFIGKRVKQIKTKTNAIEMEDATRARLLGLIAQLEKIVDHRNDIQHGLWEASPYGLGKVTRRRKGDAKPIIIQRWSADQINSLSKAIYALMPALDSALLSDGITTHRERECFSPYPMGNGSPMNLALAMADKNYLEVDEFLNQIDN